MNVMLAQTRFWGAGSEWLWAFMRFVVIALTLALIYRQVRVQTASHVVQSLSTIHTRWNSELILRARQHVCSRWVAGDRDFDGVAQYLAEFLEELGVYLRIHAVSEPELWEVQSWYVEHYYCMFKSGIAQYRQTYKDETLYSEFQMLFDRMGEMDSKRGAPHSDRSEEEITVFAKVELAVADAVLKLKPSQRHVA
jgi:hypothetical protein